jgi:hypothetical protein
MRTVTIKKRSHPAETSDGGKAMSEHSVNRSIWKSISSTVTLGSLAMMLLYAAGPADAMPNANGSFEQGILYNGYEHQGVLYNGYESQGILYNGCETKGVLYNIYTGCHNGWSYNGYENQGVLYNGQNSQGVPNNVAEMILYIGDMQGVQLNGLRQRPATQGPAIKAVILPSGETIDLR